MSDPFGPPEPSQGQPVPLPPPSGAPAPGVAPAPQSAPQSVTPPSGPNGFQLAAAGLRRGDWISAALTGVAAFVVAYLVAFLSLLLTTAFVVAGSPSGGGSGSSGSSAVPTASDLITAVTVIFGAPAQLVALADFGRLSIHGDVQVLSTLSGSIHIGFVPVLVAAAQILALVFGARLFRRKTLDLRQRAIVSVVSGAALAVVTLLVGLVLAIRLPDSTVLDIRGITAVNPLAVIVALVVGSAVTFVARPGWLAGVHPLATRLLGVVRVASVHLGVLVVVVAVVFAIWAAVTQPSGASAYPLALGNIAVLVTALGFFGGASLSDSAGSLLSTLGNTPAPSVSATVFSAGSLSLWLVVLLVVVTAFAAGLLLAVRRNSRVRSAADWVWSVAAYALVGVLLVALGTVVFSVQISGVGGSGSAGVTPWTIAILAAWGAAIEVVARYVAPRLVPSLSPTVLGFARRLVGVDSLPLRGGAVAGGMPAPGAASEVPSATLPNDTGVEAEVAPLSPRARKILIRSLVAAGIAIVLVVGGSITAGAVRSGVYGPGHAAEAYLDALGKGDASTAGKLAATKGAGGGMLTDAIFASATDRISDVAIGKASVSGDLATVAVSYRQGGKAHNTTMRLTRTGTTWLVHDTWAVGTPLTGDIPVATDGALGDVDVKVNGKTAGTTANGRAVLTAYPGTYTLSVDGSKYISAGSKKVTVSADGTLGQSATFEGQATPQLVTDAEKIVNDLIAKCVALTSGDPDDSCPIYGPGSDATGVSYTLTSKPQLKVSLGYDGQVRVSGTGGEVHTKYTEDFGGFTYNGDTTQTLYISESLSIRDGKLVLDTE